MLKDKKIIITGASGGLGVNIVEYLLEQGAHVCLVDNNETDLANITHTLRSKNKCAIIFSEHIDIADEKSVEIGINKINRYFEGVIDGLVNNAAIATNVGGMSMSDIPLELWNRVLNVNVIGTWLMTKACLASLKKSGSGKVVNIASDTALWGAPNLMSYVASKGAVISMTKSMARELGEFNICVNVVAPGLVKTPSTEYVPKHRHDLYEDNRAISRAQLPEDVSGVIGFLLSNHASFVTGQTIPVNGGFLFV